MCCGTHVLLPGQNINKGTNVENTKFHMLAVFAGLKDIAFQFRQPRLGTDGYPQREANPMESMWKESF